MSDTTPSTEGHTIIVNDHELWLIRTALQQYLSTFSHKEGGLVQQVKALLEALPKTNTPGANVNRIYPEGSSRLTL